MSIVKYYPKGVTTDQMFGLAVRQPTVYDPDKKYMVWLIGHGQGESGDGSIPALEKVVNWGGWDNIEQAVDKYNFIAVHLNTNKSYSLGEYQFALDFVKRKLPVDINNIWVVAHSLGSYGAGNWGFTDPEFTKQIRGWLISSTGGFTERDTLYQNLSKNGTIIWGVTAVNDSVVPYTYVTRVESKLKTLNPNHPIIMTVYPSTLWTDGRAAHNNTIARITRIVQDDITFNNTKGSIPTGSVAKMNLYEFTLSNPKGSIYQAPSHLYVGPIYPPTESPLPTTSTSTTTTTTQKEEEMKQYLRMVTTSTDVSFPNAVLGEVIWMDENNKSVAKERFSGDVQGERIKGITADFLYKSVTIDFAKRGPLVIPSEREV